MASHVGSLHPDASALFNLVPKVLLDCGILGLSRADATGNPGSLGNPMKAQISIALEALLKHHSFPFLPGTAHA